MKNLEELFKLCEGVKNHLGFSFKQSYECFKPMFGDFKNGGLKYESKLKGMIENGLTEEEAFYILTYTSTHSSWINFKLMKGERLNTYCEIKYADMLDNSLNKMPSYNNNNVVRMYSTSGDKIDILIWFDEMIGKTFCLPYYFSTAKINYQNSEVVWHIKTLETNSFGKDISNLTDNPSEQEVLFKRGSCFQTQSVNKEKGIVNLVETNPADGFDFELSGLYHLNIKK